MYQLKLTYFDFHGGRGEPARLALHIGDIAFEDFRFGFEQFDQIKQTTPLKQVPVLEVDGKQITQCNAITRFAGKLAGLYPTDNLQALLCDEILEAMEDVIHKLVATFGLEGDALKLAREKLVAETLTHYLQWTENKLSEQGGDYFIGQQLSVADLKVFVWIKSLNSGHLDHIPTDLVQQVAPQLNAHCQRIASHPKISDYYEQHA